MLTRRNLVGMFATVSLLPAMLTITACPISNIYKKILAYVPVGLAGFSAVLNLLKGAGIGLTPLLQSIADLVKVALADVQVAVDQYERAPASEKATWLEKIAEALTVAEANIQNFWANLTIPDQKLSALLEGLLGIIVATLLGFQAQLPAPSTPTAQQAKAMKATLRKKLSVTPKLRSVEEFRTDFNKILQDAGESKNSI